MTKFLKLLIFSLFILQLLISSSFELAHDEAYYWLFSHHLDWGYFDHPPFVAVVIRLFSFLPHHELSVRIGFILLQFATLGLIFKLLEPRYHLRATFMFFAFPLASLTGLFALPDIPLLFMTALYCLSLKDFLNRKSTGSACILGVVIALLLYAKYHGILMIFFTLLALPSLLKEKKFYLVTAISILCFLPHVWWQYEHAFATLRYHFLERPTSAFSLKRMVEFVGVQIGLAGVLAGPLVWWIVIRRKNRNDFDRSMKIAAIGVVCFFLVSTLSKKFEANWTIFLAVPLIYLTVTSELWNRRLPKALLYVSFAVGIGARLVFLLPPGTTGLKRLGEFKGWEQWSNEIKQRCEGRMVANTYQVASKLSFYLRDEVHALNYHSRKNQFDFWRWDLKKPIKDVCYITDTREFGGEEVITPEGKMLLLVKNQNYAELLSRKESVVR